MKIAVLCGGRSAERDVSLLTGATAANALRENGHKVVLLDAFLGLDTEYPPDGVFERELPIKKFTISDTSPDMRRFCKRGEGFFGKNVLEICREADIVFNALHGGEGENGKVQAAFDLLGIKYTGSGARGCMLAMDKWLSKKFFEENAVPTPRAMLFDRESFKRGGRRSVIDFAPPWVVKPVSLGSSIGVSVVRHGDELDAAFYKAFRFERYALAEEYIRGREFAVGILGGRTLPAIEIIPRDGFYDYKNKYQPGFTEEICPAHIDQTLARRMEGAALAAFGALRLKAYARVDFMVDEQNQIYALEANTLPGMTPVSLLPQEARAAGIGFNELLEIIIGESMK